MSVMTVNSYPVQKAEAFKKLPPSKSRLNKADFKVVTKGLQTQLGITQANVSQLWQLAEPDDKGEVNKSYIEEMLDIIHSQKQSEADTKFDVLSGLKFIYQNVFSDALTHQASFNAVKRCIEQSFDVGQQTLMEKVQEIQQHGQVSRIALADLIEKLENNQLYHGAKVDEDTKLDAGLDATLFDIKPDEEYSVDRDQEVINMLRNQIDLAWKECKGIAGIMKASHPEAIRKLYAILEPLPDALKNYSDFSKLARIRTQELEDDVQKLTNALEKANQTESQDSIKANKQIFDLGCELQQLKANFNQNLEKASEQLKAKLTKDFTIERISLTEQINTLENNLSKKTKEAKKLEEGRSALIDTNASLENKLAISLKSTEPKIKAVLEKAFDDPAFWEKIQKAAEMKPVDFAQTLPKGKLVIDEKELAEMKAKIESQRKNLEESGDYIEILHKEIRDLKEEINSKISPTRSSLMLQSNLNSPLEKLSPDEKSLILGKNSQISLLGVPADEFKIWSNVLYVKEGSLQKDGSGTKALEEKLASLQLGMLELEKNLASSVKSQKSLESENGGLKQKLHDSEAGLEKFKTELAGKKIELGNSAAKIAELEALIKNLKALPASQTTVPVSIPVLATVAPTPDNQDGVWKAKMIQENNRKIPRQEEEIMYIDGKRVKVDALEVYSMPKLFLPGKVKTESATQTESDLPTTPTRRPRTPVKRVEEMLVPQQSEKLEKRLDFGQYAVEVNTAGKVQRGGSNFMNETEEGSFVQPHPAGEGDAELHKQMDILRMDLQNKDQQLETNNAELVSMKQRIFDYVSKLEDLERTALKKVPQEESTTQTDFESMEQKLKEDLEKKSEQIVILQEFIGQLRQENDAFKEEKEKQHKKLQEELLKSQQAIKSIKQADKTISSIGHQDEQTFTSFNVPEAPLQLHSLTPVHISGVSPLKEKHPTQIKSNFNSLGRYDTIGNPIIPLPESKLIQSTIEENPADATDKTKTKFGYDDDDEGPIVSVNPSKITSSNQTGQVTQSRIDDDKRKSIAKLMQMSQKPKEASHVPTPVTAEPTFSGPFNIRQQDGAAPANTKAVLPASLVESQKEQQQKELLDRNSFYFGNTFRNSQTSPHNVPYILPLGNNPAQPAPVQPSPPQKQLSQEMGLLTGSFGLPQNQQQIKPDAVKPSPPSKLESLSASRPENPYRFDNASPKEVVKEEPKQSKPAVEPWKVDPVIELARSSKNPYIDDIPDEAPRSLPKKSVAHQPPLVSVHPDPKPKTEPAPIAQRREDFEDFLGFKIGTDKVTSNFLPPTTKPGKEQLLIPDNQALARKSDLQKKETSSFNKSTIQSVFGKKPGKVQIEAISKHEPLTLRKRDDEQQDSRTSSSANGSTEEQRRSHNVSSERLPRTRNKLELPRNCASAQRQQHDEEHLLRYDLQNQLSR